MAPSRMEAPASWYPAPQRFPTAWTVCIPVGGARRRTEEPGLESK